MSTLHSKRLFGLTLILLFFGSSAVIAQRVSVSEAIAVKKDDYYQILGKIKDLMLFSTDNGYTLDLMAFDEKLRLLWKKELELDKRRTQVIGVIPHATGFSVIYQYSRKGDNYLKAHRYSETGILQDSLTLSQFEQSYNPPDCRMVLSEDHSKALIYFVEKQERLNVQTIDLTSLSKIWTTHVAIEASTFFRHFRSLILDNHGKMYLLLEKDSKRSKSEEHRLELIQFFTGDISPMSRHISLENLASQKVKFVYDNLNDRLVGIGLTVDKNPENATGLFCFYLDQLTEGVFELHQMPFSPEINRKMTGTNDETNKGLEDLEIREILLRKDGGIVIILEEVRRLERNIAGQQFQFGPGGSRYIVDYYYEDLMVVSIGPNGAIDWQEVFPKKQYSQDDDGLYSSTLLMTAPDQIRLVFNDEIAYENTVSAYTIDHTGALERSSILSTDYQKLKLIFREGMQTGVYEVLVPSERGGKIKLVKVEF
jgi:hypothetical protein